MRGASFEVDPGCRFAHPGYACWLGMQSQYDIAVVERETGAEIT
jgi:hypothetical protein